MFEIRLRDSSLNDGVCVGLPINRQLIGTELQPFAVGLILTCDDDMERHRWQVIIVREEPFRVFDDLHDAARTNAKAAGYCGVIINAVLPGEPGRWYFYGHCLCGGITTDLKAKAPRVGSLLVLPLRSQMEGEIDRYLSSHYADQLALIAPPLQSRDTPAQSGHTDPDDHGTQENQSP